MYWFRKNNWMQRSVLFSFWRDRNWFYTFIRPYAVCFFLFRFWFEIIHCHEKIKKNNNKELRAKNQLWFIIDIAFWFVAFWTTSDCKKFIFFRWVSSHFLMSSTLCEWVLSFVQKKIKLQNNNVLNKSHFIFTIIFHRNWFWCILVVCFKMRIWQIW